MAVGGRVGKGRIVVEVLGVELWIGGAKRFKVKDPIKEYRDDRFPIYIRN